MQENTNHHYGTTKQYNFLPWHKDNFIMWIHRKTRAVNNCDAASVNRNSLENEPDALISM